MIRLLYVALYAYGSPPICSYIYGGGYLLEFISLYGFSRTSRKMSDDMSPAFLVWVHNKFRAMRGMEWQEKRK